MLGSLRFCWKKFLSRMCRASSCSGIQSCATAGEALLEPACPQLCTAHTSWPCYRQEGPNRREVVGVFPSSKCMDILSVGVKILAVCYQIRPCVSLCERLKLSPRNRPSSFQLPTRGMMPIEDMYHISSHCFFFLQTLHQMTGYILWAYPTRRLRCLQHKAGLNFLK